MKKIVLFIVFTTVINIVNAQMNYGVKIGLNIASLNGYKEIDVDTKYSFHVGGMAEISVIDRFSIQPEILYSSQGATIKDEQQTPIRLNYVTIPVMAKYYLLDGFSLEAGPYLAANIEATKGRNDTKVDINDTNGIDYGVGLGASYKLPNTLSFGLRYNMGMANIYDTALNDAPEVKNGVFQFSVGYYF